MKVFAILMNFWIDKWLVGYIGELVNGCLDGYVSGWMVDGWTV